MTDTGLPADPAIRSAAESAVPTGDGRSGASAAQPTAPAAAGPSGDLAAEPAVAAIGEAMTALGELDRAPVGEHAEVYHRLHETLRAALAEIHG